MPCLLQAIKEYQNIHSHSFILKTTTIEYWSEVLEIIYTPRLMHYDETHCGVYSKISLEWTSVRTEASKHQIVATPSSSTTCCYGLPYIIKKFMYQAA